MVTDKSHYLFFNTEKLLNYNIKTDFFKTYKINIVNKYI